MSEQSDGAVYRVTNLQDGDYKLGGRIPPDRRRSSLQSPDHIRYRSRDLGQACTGVRRGCEGQVSEQSDDVLRRRGGRAAFEHDPDTPTWLPGLTMAEVALLWEEYERKKREETND